MKAWKFLNNIPNINLITQSPTKLMRKKCYLRRPLSPKHYLNKFLLFAQICRLNPKTPCLAPLLKENIDFFPEIAGNMHFIIFIQLYR